jgi:hypothetical protein
MAPEGNVRVSCSAVLKLLRARLRATPVFAGAGWGPELPIVFGDTGIQAGQHFDEGQHHRYYLSGKIRLHPRFPRGM